MGGFELLNLFEDVVKDFGVMFDEVREDFTVQFDIGFFELID